MPFAGYKDFAACVAQNQDKGDPDAYCGSIKHKVEKHDLGGKPHDDCETITQRVSVVKQHPDEYPEDWGSDVPYQSLAEIDEELTTIEKHFTPGSPHQHGQGAHTSMEQPRSGEEEKPPKPAHQKPFPRKKDVFAKACPPGQHKHGGHDYCHDEGRKHRTHAGEAVHGIKYPKQQVTKPRARKNPMHALSMPAVENRVAVGCKRFGRELLEQESRLRDKVPPEVGKLLRQAAHRFLADDPGGGLDAVEAAHKLHAKEWKPYGGESKMKKAEKKRQDAEPTVTYDEPYAEIYEVGKRLKAVSKALERQIRRQARPTIAEDIQRLEKRARTLTTSCC